MKARKGRPLSARFVQEFAGFAEQVTAAEKVVNRGGRPKAAEPSSTVCTWLTASEHDRLIALAKQQRSSVAAIVRKAVRVTLQSSAAVVLSDSRQ